MIYERIKPGLNVHTKSNLHDKNNFQFARTYLWYPSDMSYFKHESGWLKEQT